MNCARSGCTVSFRKVSDFDQLPLSEATHILYNELIPACEAKGVMLSSYGNHASPGSLSSVEYDEKKANRDLFRIEDIQKAFASIPHIVRSTSDYKSGSYGLKHVVERHPAHNKYITNGDLIAAMLLHGFKARFGKQNETMNVNCEFKVKAKEG